MAKTAAELFREQLRKAKAEACRACAEMAEAMAGDCKDITGEAALNLYAKQIGQLADLGGSPKRSVQ